MFYPMHKERICSKARLLAIMKNKLGCLPCEAQETAKRQLQQMSENEFGQAIASRRLLQLRHNVQI